MNQITKVIEVKFFFLIRQLSSSGQMVIRQLLAVVMQSLDSFQAVVKGQLISKCPFGVIVWTKIATKKFDNLLARRLTVQQLPDDWLMTA